MGPAWNISELNTLANEEQVGVAAYPRAQHDAITVTSMRNTMSADDIYSVWVHNPLDVTKVRVAPVLWFFGLSGAGKTTLCKALSRVIHARGIRVFVIDGDEMRSGLCSDLGFSPEDRAENVRRLAHVAKLMAETNCLVLVAAITPYESLRALVRSIIPSVREVFVDAPLAVCEARDPKGLYVRARTGYLKNFTGVGSQFECPSSAHLTCHTGNESVEESVNKVLKLLDSLELVAS